MSSPAVSPSAGSSTAVSPSAGSSTAVSPPSSPPVRLALWADPLRIACDTLAGLCGGTAEEAARGVALGFWFGLMPKENATACVLGVALAAVRLNLAAAAWAALVAAALAPLLDPGLHRLGLALLTADALHGTFASLLALPGGAWSGWDNTVTLAALLIGGAVAWPLHRGTRLVHGAVAGPLGDWWATTRLGRLLTTVQAAGRLAGGTP